MDGARIGVLARPLEPLTPGDTLARAAEVLRSVPFDSVPVVDGGLLVGIVSERTITEAARVVFLGEASSEQLGMAALGNGFIAPAAPLSAESSLEEAALAFQGGRASLPVVDAGGGYVGMVNQTDLASALLRPARPRAIGGMATPLGVYLTTGAISAGARGSLGLLLTGASIAAMATLASLLVGLLVHLVERSSGIPVRASLLSPPIGPVSLNVYDIWRHLLPVLGMIVFAVLLRASPLAGYHAAEHQVVHAIEKNQPLTPASVACMPRVHPRCGTRFLAIFVLITLFGIALPISDWQTRFVAAVIAVVMWWRKMGDHLQNRVTTKRASLKQMQSAIAAAEELLVRYRHSQPRRASLASRIWHMGILQVVAGSYIAGAILAQWAERYGLPLFWSW